jgi:hypothetical protein
MACAALPEGDGLACFHFAVLGLEVGGGGSEDGFENVASLFGVASLQKRKPLLGIRSLLSGTWGRYEKNRSCYQISTTVHGTGTEPHCGREETELQ